MVQGRLELLQEDVKLLDDVERQIAVYRDDMDRQFALRMATIENVLLQLEQRGHAYFDEMLRLGRVFDLLNKSRIQEGFEREVVADAPVQVERGVSDLIDWMVGADLQQWQQVTLHLAAASPAASGSHRRRSRGGAPSISNGPACSSRSAARRSALVDGFDRQREAAALAEGARNAVAAAAAIGAGALGLGTIVTLAATTAAADVTGILLAGAMATLGLFVIPARRRQAKAQLRSKVTTLRETLATALREQFQKGSGAQPATASPRASPRTAGSFAPSSSR